MTAKNKERYSKLICEKHVSSTPFNSWLSNDGRCRITTLVPELLPTFRKKSKWSSPVELLMKRGITPPDYSAERGVGGGGARRRDKEVHNFFTRRKRSLALSRPVQKGAQLRFIQRTSRLRSNSSHRRGRTHYGKMRLHSEQSLSAHRVQQVRVREEEKILPETTGENSGSSA